MKAAALKLSIIICIHNMAREAPRTILSACTPYQKDVDPTEYEVIIVDNGSAEPFALSQELASGLLPCPQIVRFGRKEPSPVFALNWAATTLARGRNIMFCIDGARIFSNHLVSSTLRAQEMLPEAFVHSLSCHIGPKVQMISTHEGYDEEAEDKLIANANWPQNAAGIYTISVLAGSSAGGFFQPILESNAFSISQSLFRQHGGYNEKFCSPGGGLANLEIFSRYVERPNAQNVCLLSDLTFHQTHGGVATSRRSRRVDFDAEYASIFGREYTIPKYQTLYLGPVRDEVKSLLAYSTTRA